mmetsp:Transcript_53168/g.78913  ORF Transcript_53168/g.78913 Transcript_53168/m.78913 type:complete len:224 (+) Transcript_53168:175-846(+)
MMCRCTNARGYKCRVRAVFFSNWNLYLSFEANGDGRLGPLQRPEASVLGCKTRFRGSQRTRFLNPSSVTYEVDEPNRKVGLMHFELLGNNTNSTRVIPSFQFRYGKNYRSQVVPPEMIRTSNCTFENVSGESNINPSDAGGEEERATFNTRTDEGSGSAADSVRANGVRVCIMCFSQPVDSTFVHGVTGHSICCFECAQQVCNRNKICPVCRQRVDIAIRNFS